MRMQSSIFVLQHNECLHNVPVYNLVLNARKKVHGENDLIRSCGMKEPGNT